MVMQGRKGMVIVEYGVGLWTRNVMGEAILNFTMAFDIGMANMYLQKREDHVVTFKSGLRRSQIDYFIITCREQSNCMCKFISKESYCTMQAIDF